MHIYLQLYYLCGAIKQDKNQMIMTTEINRLRKEIKDWKSPEVQERFKRVDSMLPTVVINQLQEKIKRLKRV